MAIAIKWYCMTRIKQLVGYNIIEGLYSNKDLCTLVFPFNGLQIMKKNFGVQPFVNIIKPIIKSLFPILVYCHECNCLVAGEFIYYFHNWLEMA